VSTQAEYGEYTRESTRTARGKRRTRDAELSEAPRTGAKRAVMETIRQIPAYLKLLGGLFTDRRVAAVDKMLVAGAIAYILLPFDFVPDFIPFLGEVDDVFLLVTSLQRLISNAGRQVVLDHWSGDISELADLNLKRVVSAASFFLPIGIRRKLKRLMRG
jgi:uncharacterized membrane protein YkvA (DUF1232 family)